MTITAILDQKKAAWELALKEFREVTMFVGALCSWAACGVLGFLMIMPIAIHRHGWKVVGVDAAILFVMLVIFGPLSLMIVITRLAEIISGWEL